MVEIDNKAAAWIAQEHILGEPVYLRLPDYVIAPSLLETMIGALNAALYADAVTAAMPRGHGVMAEKANHLIDTITGSSAQHVGGTNVLNGADRIVDGILIQTKYCGSGGKCISSCFGPNGFRYMADGTPMQIEVPKDFHKAAVQAMEVRIRRGEVPGVTDPKDAANIVRPGHLTYEQAVNLGKAGTIESITYDAVTGTVVAGCAFGLSAAVRFAQGVWRGDDVGHAAAEAVETGLGVGGIALVTSILSNQLARTAFDQALKPVSAFIVDGMSTHTVLELAAAFGRVGISSRSAEAYVSRVLRGHLVGMVASCSVLLSIDAYHYVVGRMSGEEAFRSMTTKVAGIAGGNLGWMAGSAKGSCIGTIIPGVGTAAGAIVGGLAGGMAGGSLTSYAAQQALDVLLLDPMEKLQRQVEIALAQEIEWGLMDEELSRMFMDRMITFGIEDFAPLLRDAPDPIAACRLLVRRETIRISSSRMRVELPSHLMAA